jgi:hypothetical protein
LKAVTGRNKTFIYLYHTELRLLSNSNKILGNFPLIIQASENGPVGNRHFGIESNMATEPPSIAAVALSVFPTSGDFHTKLRIKQAGLRGGQNVWEVVTQVALN